MNKKSKMSRLAIVDDRKDISKSLTAGLTATGNYEVLFTAGDGKEFMEQMMKARKQVLPDVVIMDIDMPGMNGIEAVRGARDIYPQCLFLMLTIFDDDDKIFEAIQAGANGYLLKDEPIERIIHSIEELIKEGGAPMSPAIARKTLHLLSKSGPFKKQKESALANSLSEKEIIILKHLIEGSEYKEIAAITGNSPFTVRNHITNIYKKLHVTSKAQAINLALKKNWF